MYKFNRNSQITFSDFNQPMGMKMNANNRWVKKAEMIPWEKIMEKYAELFPSKTGMPAKPLRMALGSLLIQKQYGYSNVELVEQLKENPYYQYFIGMPGYEDKYPFVPSLLVEFRKRLSEEILSEVNEIIISSAMSEKDDSDNDDDNNSDNGSSNDKENETANSGTLMLDATCAPQNIEYPQDVNLLNECREKLERLIDKICYDFNYYTPRMYRENARKDYLSLAKCKKRPAKRIRKAVKQQLQYVRRDLKYVDEFLALDDVKLTEKQAEMLDVIRKIYEQQKFMFENNTHSVENRIVSISQPYIRPIVRGKAKSPVEFGAKLDKNSGYCSEKLHKRGVSCARFQGGNRNVPARISDAYPLHKSLRAYPLHRCEVRGYRRCYGLLLRKRYEQKDTGILWAFADGAAL